MRNDDIARFISENNIKLLGQIEVSDDEYQELIAYVHAIAPRLYMPTIVPSDLVLSLALVQIAIRCYKDGRYWPCFEKQIGCTVSSSKTNYIGAIFYKTIQSYQLFNPRIGSGDHQYVEYIKAHAFVTDEYMQGFYDFAYAYFERNLFRQIPSQFEDDVEDLSDFMRTTLHNKNDKLIEQDPKKASKSYRLLKSTRTVFALCDSNIVAELFLPVLDLIDRYFYDNDIPTVSQNRYERAFIEWCRAAEAKEAQKIDRSKTKRRPASHHPYIHVDIDKELSFLVIPPQKFRPDDCDGRVEAFVEINGYMQKVNVEVYKSFGIYITEEERIPIPSVFDDISVTIKTKTERRHQIPENSYRIFNRSCDNISRFEKGYNFVLVKPNIAIRWKNEADILDYSDGYSNWQYVSVKVSPETVMYVGEKPISIIGEYSSEPIFERKITHFQAFDDKGRELIIVREHPLISFIVDKDRLQGTVLRVNGEAYIPKNFYGYVCYDSPEDTSKYVVNLTLNDSLPYDNGEYEIVLDVPGLVNKVLTSYLLLRKFDCRFSRPRYTYAENALLTVTKGDCVYSICSETWSIDNEKERAVIYSIPLMDNPEKAELTLYLGKPYRISMPIKTFLYGFSQTAMESQWVEYIWYADIKENVYVKIPGATKVRAYYEKDVSFKIDGVCIGDGLFRVDISEFVRRIQEAEKKAYHYINLEYEDNAVRSLNLPPILRNVIVDPYFKVYADGSVPYMDIALKGRAKVFLQATTGENSKIVFDRKLVVNGRTELPELSKDGFYHFYPTMEENSSFGFFVKKTKMKDITTGCIDLQDFTGCTLVVRSLECDEEFLPLSFQYCICMDKKEDDDTYVGRVYGRKIEKISTNGRITFEKAPNGKPRREWLGKVLVYLSRIEDEFQVSLQLYSEQDKDWRSLYYDKKTKSLLHFDNPLLDSCDATEDRFLFLDEYDADVRFLVDMKNSWKKG